MKDYNAKLAEDYNEIKGRVVRGMLPLVARNPSIDKAVSAYALARADHYHAEQSAGKNPPIPFKDSVALEKYADLILYEELKWSHPDKMTIVEYPVMSDSQSEGREEKFTPHSDLQYGDRRYLGRRKSHFTDDTGAPQVRNGRMTNPPDPAILAIEDYADLYSALEKSGLTDRQRQAIDLVYFEIMTQEEAGEVMSIRKWSVNEHLNKGLRKLREYMTKYTELLSD